MCLVCGQGCTSVLSTASLRDLVWDGGEPHAAEAATAASDSAGSDDESGDDASAADGVDSAASQALDAERRDAAIDEAVERLAKLGSIDEATRATLMATLDRTAPEDWPTVIDAFAESLPPATHVAAKADLDAGEPTAATPAPEPRPEAATTMAPGDATTEASPQASAAIKGGSTAAHDEVPIVTVAVPVAPEQSAADSPPEPPVPADEPLTIENACFATRVQAWGVVDRFAADQFRPGQEVIVYFELGGLSASESSAGHTTCIDSALRLVSADGTTIHTWSFEPIAETCQARRHDYFARYVVRLPETAPGGACRLELGVTDTLSGKVASTTLPLELLQPLAAREPRGMARSQAGRVE